VRRFREGVRGVGEFCVLWFSAAITLALLAAALPGFQLQSSDETGVSELLGRAVLLAWVFGILNALLWPLLVRALLRVSALLVLVALFVVNGSLMLVALRVVPEARVTYLPDALLISLVLSTVTSLVSGALAARTDDAYQLMLVRRSRRRIRRSGATAEHSTPGLLCLQLDGLGHEVLRRAVVRGDVPNLARLLRSGSHRLQRWHTDWSSQTGASQLGILHGDNTEVPGFRWYEKDTGRVLVMSSPSDTHEVEERVGQRRGLLADDGASHGNLFTGGAEHSTLVVSTVRHSRGVRGRAGYGSYFVDPSNTVRTTLRLVAEVVREVVQGLRQRRLDIRPRVRRGGTYPFVRAFATVVETDVVVAAVAGAVLEGRSIIYADLVGYDEVAHHSGVERPETMAVLRRLDAEIGLLVKVAARAARRYELVVLSDHGQSQGEPFRARYGSSLEDLVRRGCALDGSGRPTRRPRAEGRGAEARAASARVVRPPAPPVVAEHEPVVLGSGNLGLISFPDLPGRATLEAVDALHPGLVEELLAHEGIGFVLVAREHGGSVVIGRSGSVVLATGAVHGTDPLAPFGPGALEVVRRTDTFPHVADLMVNSAYFPDTDEVSAFEEQVGSHGGLGGQQSVAFLLHPVHLPPPAVHLQGAVAVHDVLRGWQHHLQHPAPDSVPAPESIPAGVTPAGSRPTADQPG
jgi:uncharacterized membrane protein YvlD (DUF360 family)